MKFAHPLVLWFFWIPFAVAGFYYIAFKMKHTYYAKFGDPSVLNRLIAPETALRLRWKAWLTIGGIFLLWCAAAGPQLGARLVEVHRRGVDILIAVDCSKSMLAEDILPNRLARAKLALSSLIQSLEGDRVGIIAFAGTAFLQCPLTLDYSAAKMFLDFIDTNVIPRPGTALGEAIMLGIKSFSRKERKYKVLVLLTDGEDHDSDPLTAAREAAREGIKIITIGIGSPDGEPIPIRDKQNAVTGYKKDSAGNIIMSKLDETTLQKIALETGGTYFRAMTGEFEIEGIRNEIGRMEKKELQSRMFNQYENRFQVFLLLALILLCFEFILPERGKIFSLKKGLMLVAVFFLAVSVEGATRKKVNSGNSLFNNERYSEALEKYLDAQIDDPESPVLHFNTGNTYYRSGDYEKAYQEYQKAVDAKDIDIQAEAYYNMGNVLYRTGKLPESILHYRKSLELDETDEDAKYNIEFIQKKLKEMADKNKEQQPDQQQEQQQQQQQQQQQDTQDQGDTDKKQGKDQQREEKSSQDTAQGKKPKKKGSMSQEDAERLLNSLEDQEKEAQKKRRQGRPQTQGVVEDW